MVNVYQGLAHSQNVVGPQLVFIHLPSLCPQVSFSSPSVIGEQGGASPSRETLPSRKSGMAEPPSRS